MPEEKKINLEIIQEIKCWQKEGIISLEQSKNLISRYSLLPTASEKSALAKVITIISILGSILMGVGIILFFASNWRGIPKLFKLFLILFSIFTTYFIGYTLSFVKKTYSKTGNATILLGTILFGAGIYLVAQIYHFPANYPGGVLFWTIGILPIGYILRLNPVIFFSSLLLILWNILRMTGLDQPNYFYLLLFSLTLLLSYRIKSNRLIFINLLGLIYWFIAHLYLWSRNYAFDNILFLNFGALLYATGRLHETNLNLNPFKIPYKSLGVFLILLTSYIFTHESTHEYYLSSQYRNVFTIETSLTLIFFVLITAIVFILLRQKKKDKVIRCELFTLQLILSFGIFYSLFPKISTCGIHATGEFQPYPFIFNIILFCEIIGIIILGYFEREIYLVNLGIIFFAIQALTFYFDTFWEMLPRSLFFIFGGLILLLGGGYLEKKRGVLITKIKSGEVKTNEPKS